MLEGSFVSYANYNFDKTALELARSQWPNYDDQHYLRGCKWSPDGTCLLTVVRGAGMHVMELPSDLYTADKLLTSRPIQPLNPAVSVPESGLIYDYCWYPGMNSGNPATCCWAASGHEGPIHLWDAFTGTLRCSYRGYNSVDELEAALSVTFSADGQNIFCGYKKNVKIFSTGRPGREYVEYPTTHPASCLVASMAQPGVVAIGTWKNTIELVSQCDGTFRHLCKLQGHKGGITTMVFSLDGTRLYSGARKDKEIVCWDLRVPGRPIFCVNRESNTNQKIAIDISTCGKWLVTGGTDGVAQAWNVAENTAPTVHMQRPQNEKTYHKRRRHLHSISLLVLNVRCRSTRTAVTVSACIRIGRSWRPHRVSIMRKIHSCTLAPLLCTRTRSACGGWDRSRRIPICSRPSSGRPRTHSGHSLCVSVCGMYGIGHNKIVFVDRFVL